MAGFSAKDKVLAGGVVAGLDVAIDGLVGLIDVVAAAGDERGVGGGSNVPIAGATIETSGNAQIPSRGERREQLGLEDVENGAGGSTEEVRGGDRETAENAVVEEGDRAGVDNASVGVAQVGGVGIVAVSARLAHVLETGEDFGRDGVLGAEPEGFLGEPVVAALADFIGSAAGGGGPAERAGDWGAAG